MGQLEMISGAVTAYLLLSGLLVQLSHRVITASRQHQLAFVTIIVLIFGILPQLRQPLVAPGIIFHLAMMLFALHLSAYYSGTSKNSAHLYSLILYLAAIVIAPMSHLLFTDWSIFRFLLMGGAWMILAKVETTISGRSYTLSLVEKNLLWVWFISAVMGQWEPQAKLLPDLFFPVILLVHMEKRWPKLSVPAPMIALYGMLVAWYGHFALSGIPGGSAQTLGSLQALGTTNLTILALIVVCLVSFGLRGHSIAKQFLYLFLAQEVLLLGLGFENFFLPSQELIGLLRVLLFISLIGLFVMIESGENEGLDKATLRSLVWERPRFTSSVILVSVIFAIYPLVYVSSGINGSNLLLFLLVLIVSAWTANLVRTLFTRVNRDYRILRPSLSIWSTVVFTILWAAVVLVEIVSRNFISDIM